MNAVVHKRACLVLLIALTLFAFFLSGITALSLLGAVSLPPFAQGVLVGGTILYGGSVPAFWKRERLSQARIYHS
jgi:hypothetical protein